MFWALNLFTSLPVFRRQHPGCAEVPRNVREAGRFLRVSSWQHGVFRPVGGGRGSVPSPCWHHPQLHGSHGHLPLSGQESLTAGQRRWVAVSSGGFMSCHVISCAWCVRHVFLFVDLFFMLLFIGSQRIYTRQWGHSRPTHQGLPSSCHEHVL